MLWMGIKNYPSDTVDSLLFLERLRQTEGKRKSGGGTECISSVILIFGNVTAMITIGPYR